jgi:hypothetical protein
LEAAPEGGVPTVSGALGKKGMAQALVSVIQKNPNSEFIAV